MNSTTPHYLLLAEASRTAAPGRWRFALRPLDGSAPVEVADVEPDLWGERLDLLTVVRALESLDQPSGVTLVGCSRYVEQGLMYGLAEWRENQWRWEYFGQMVPVRDADLWQRMDRILQFHRVNCRQRRLDADHELPASQDSSPANGQGKWKYGFASPDWLKYRAAAVVALCTVCGEAVSRYWQMGIRMLASSSLLLHRS